MSDMNLLFDVSDKIHVLQENNSPVLLFKNCESIKRMLELEMSVYVDDRLSICHVFNDIATMENQKIENYVYS